MLFLQVNRSGYHFLTFVPFLPERSKRIRSKSVEENKSSDRRSSIISSISVTRKIVRQVIHNNFVSGRVSFLTLTFRSEEFSDYDKSVYEFTKFIKRLNFYVFNTKRAMVKYLCVPEKQKRGVWHFHVLLFDFPYVDNDRLSSLWGLGFVKINQVKDVNHLVSYILKYITKDMFQNEKNRKRIYTSKNLDRGIRIYGSEATDKIHFWLYCLTEQKDVKLVSSRWYEGDEYRVLFEVYFSHHFYDWVRDFLVRRVRGIRRLTFSDDGKDDQFMRVVRIVNSDLADDLTNF